jgi:hypothetical protein
MPVDAETDAILVKENTFVTWVSPLCQLKGHRDHQMGHQKASTEDFKTVLGIEDRSMQCGSQVELGLNSQFSTC